MGDPTVRLVLKIYPTVNNYWNMGEENARNIALHKGTWYFEGAYYTIVSGENGFLGEGLYRMMIDVWWVLTLGITIFFLSRLLKRQHIT